MMYRSLSCFLLLVLSSAGCGPRCTLSGLDVLEQSGFAELRGKNIGLVVNHTSVDQEGRHITQLLADETDIHVRVVFAPEHGFRGTRSAGEKIGNGLEPATGARLVSLYGDKKKPDHGDLAGLDLLIFDMQDAGARYYTYASTLTLAMQAAAEEGIPVMVLDRPNPLNGADVEGPLMEPSFQSFVGMHPVPVRHGLTLGELARMISACGWLGEGLEAELLVLPMQGWDRGRYYSDTGLKWTPPSPNIPDVETAFVYLGTCLLEGTNVSEGRGTDTPFVVFGAPWMDDQAVLDGLEALSLPGFAFELARFAPKSMPGAAKPKYEDLECKGIRIKVLSMDSADPLLLGLHVLNILNRRHPDDFGFLKSRFIDRLYGSDRLREAVENMEGVRHLPEEWKSGLEAFGESRKPFLLY